MGLQGPPIQRHDVQIISTDYQYNGQLEAVGPVGNFVNDPTRQSLSLYDVQLAPLKPGSPLKTLSRPHIVILKPNIVFAYFVSAEARDTISRFALSETLMLYTPLAVCRGNFHMPAEANLRDFLGVVPSELLVISEAQIFPFVELPLPFSTKTELVLLGRSYLQFYHTP
jgi:hypothetical protein